MLHELRIENLLLIERAELRLGAGLNVITGETGAGKTVLAHSLDLLMGGKARAQIVRPGADEAYVEGVFDLPPGLFDDPDLADLAERIPEDGDEIVLGRRVFANGRTSAFVQGRSATAADLRLLGSRLLAFYGQHEHRKLTLASAQMEILDGFAGDEHLAMREQYRAAHSEVGAAARRLDELRNREGARMRDIDLLRFELDEIETVAPTVNERQALTTDRDRLRNLEGLVAAAGAGVEAVSGGEEPGAAGLLAAAGSQLEGVSGVDAELDALAARLEAAALELDDTASDLRRYLDSLESEPGGLEAIEERLAAIERLERKYGGNVEAVLEHAAECRQRLDELENSEKAAGEMEAVLAEAEAKRAGLAAKLSSTRADAAKRLAKIVATELAGLAMDGAKLEVSLEPVPAVEGRTGTGFGPGGAETVELLVATNPGMPPSPLRDSASGGELSRVMLALTIAGRGAAGATLVFDEIDAGIGGNTGRLVGEKLRELAGHGQVLCITHLPQIAALAANHFTVAKFVDEGVTTASVEAVAGEELVAEIVRMLGGGEAADAADRHARELLAAA